MKWSEIRIHTTNEAIEPISHILDENGANGLVIEDRSELLKDHETLFGEIYALNPDDYPEEGVYIKTYLPNTDKLVGSVQAIKQAIENLRVFDIDIGKNDIKISEVDEEEWATSWQKYYKPVQVSERITVVPTWEEYTPKSSEELIIELDPGMAFGTGTHPTTKLSVQALDKYIQANDTVIDVGCGSGVLSIASVKLGAKNVYAYDLDEVAIRSTELNANLNKVEESIHSKQNDLLQQIDLQADIIVSNILAEIIIRFIGDAWNNLKDGGLFITSGIIQMKKQLVIDHLQQQGFEIKEINELEDWISIVAKK